MHLPPLLEAATQIPERSPLNTGPNLSNYCGKEVWVTKSKCSKSSVILVFKHNFQPSRFTRGHQWSRGIATGGISVFIPPKSAQVNFYGVKMTSERLFNSFIPPSKKNFYTPQKKFLATPLQWSQNTSKELCGYCWSGMGDGSWWDSRWLVLTPHCGDMCNTPCWSSNSWPECPCMITWVD